MTLLSAFLPVTASNKGPGAIIDLLAQSPVSQLATVLPQAEAASPAALARQRDAGISRAVLMLPPAPREEILPLLDDYARLIEAIA